MEPVEVCMMWRHITKHCFTPPFKAISPLDDMPSMFPHPIDTDLPPQINPMKHCISVNITREFLGSSHIGEWQDSVYVSLLRGNIQVAPLHSTLSSLQRTTLEGPLIQLRTAATSSTIAKKQVGNTLGNNVYISKFTKPISCS